MKAEIEQRAERWCKPITAEAFCGEPSRYEDNYERMLEETAKLELPHGGECNWKAVLECADALLTEKTKDMVVLGSLSIALLDREGVTGLAAGLRAYRWLIEHHSKSLFPKVGRKRGRAGAMSWFTGQLEYRLTLVEPKPEQRDAIGLCRDEFERLNELVRAELAEMHPRTGRISSALVGLVDGAAPKAELAPAAAAPAEPLSHRSADSSAPESALPGATAATSGAGSAGTAAGASAATSAAAAAGDGKKSFRRRGGFGRGPAESSARPAAGSNGVGLAAAGAPGASAAATQPPSSQPAPSAAFTPELATRITNDKQAAAALEAVEQTLRALALFHLEAHASQTLGYRLAHLASFVGVVPDGDRTVQPPSPKLLRQMRDDLQRKRYAKVVSAAADSLRDKARSLDTERLLAQALRGQGNLSPATVVDAHAFAFYRQMDGLASLSPETRAWLERIGGAAETQPPAAGRAAAAGAATPGPSAVEGVVSQAQQTARQEGLDAGCRELHLALAGQGAKPQRFRLRLATAGLCLEHKAPDLARPILQDLYAELQDPIAQWEPDLLVEVATTTLACNRQLSQVSAERVAEELAAETDRMMTLLAKVAPAVAIRERGKK